MAGRLVRLRDAFPGRVRSVFPGAAPFDGQEYAGFAQFLISNLLGGLGFFHGDSKVDQSRSPAYEETDVRFWDAAAIEMRKANVTAVGPVSLLSHTPSRPFFPRGFLWDEGFHLLPVLEWDLDLAVAVVKSWLALMDGDGWIAREQILGPEARSKVPPEFQTQYPHYANPPTLLLLVQPLVSRLTKATPYRGNPSVYLASESAARSLLEDIYPLLCRHYRWFRTTQAGDLSKAFPRPQGFEAGEAYRWRGRTPRHCLTSGLDDYPRANPPHPGELHVDALSWVGAAADAMHGFALHMRRGWDASLFAGHAAAARRNLDVLHWDPAREAYCDATVRDGGFERVCHLGYVSLMPFLLGLVGADHTHLPAVLDLMADPERLWSPHGLRSLTPGDDGYGRDEDYWRGAVWMNLNVLAVLRLRQIGEQDGPERNRARVLAAELRDAVLHTVYDSWKATGFVWEQYDDKTGQGRRSKAFTGWTACVLLLFGLEDQGRRRSGLHGDEAPPVGGGMSGWLSSQPLWFSFALMVLLVALRRRLVVLWRSGIGSQMSGRRSRRHES